MEVATIVFGIVSAFGTASQLYSAWRERRRERKEKKENGRLHELVKSSGPRIRDEYDRDLRRLGEVFRRGDDVGRLALMQQLITLQQTVIALLSDRQAYNILGNTTFPRHENIYTSSLSVRRQTLLSLGEQYQRLLPAAPLRTWTLPSRTSPSPEPTPTRDSSAYSRRARRNPEEVNAGYNCFEMIMKSSQGFIDMWECGECIWEYPRSSSPRFLTTSDDRLLLEYCFMQKFHAIEEKGVCGFRCFICKDSLRPRQWMRAHIKEEHTWAEICGDDCCMDELGDCGKRKSGCTPSHITLSRLPQVHVL